MQYIGSAYTVDKFHPLVCRELRLLPDFVWRVIHNLNGSKQDVPLEQEPDFKEIEEYLEKHARNIVRIYKRHPDVNEIYVHSLYMPWRILKFAYTRDGQYSYEVMVLN